MEFLARKPIFQIAPRKLEAKSTLSVLQQQLRLHQLDQGIYWRQVLKEAKLRGEDIGVSATLMRYQEWRRFDATSLALATDTFNRLFSNDNSLLRLGRDMGMAMINAVPKARRSFIREAAGLTGTLPDLMR